MLPAHIAVIVSIGAFCIVARQMPAAPGPRFSLVYAQDGIYGGDFYEVTEGGVLLFAGIGPDDCTYIPAPCRALGTTNVFSQQNP